MCSLYSVCAPGQEKHSLDAAISLLHSPRSRSLAYNPQPHPYGLVIACGGEALAIGGPRHARHKISMPFVGEQGGTAAGIPHPHGLIEACGGEALAIGRPRYAVHS